MATRTITCEDCGSRSETTRANTKYCKTCRLFRNVVFIGHRTKTCIECEKRFAPLDRADVLCGSCDFTRPLVAGHCALCDRDTERLLHADVKVCSMCATDPDKRVLFQRALAKKRRRNKDGEGKQG